MNIIHSSGWIFTKYTDETKQRILDSILATDKKIIAESVELLEKVRDRDNVCVIGNKQAIEKCSDQLDEIFSL